MQENLRASTIHHSKITSDLKEHQLLVINVKEENERLRRELQGATINQQERIGSLTRENDELKRRINEVGDIHRRLNEQ